MPFFGEVAIHTAASRRKAPAQMVAVCLPDIAASRKSIKKPDRVLETPSGITGLYRLTDIFARFFQRLIKRTQQALADLIDR